ncbi:MAG: PEP-CTERM sorting domain-containing protein [Fimbriimonadaceae bacterium]|nr:PEP-CTERM sorting domain-containing protein [Fimbriimonadaceae bacterium]
MTNHKSHGRAFAWRTMMLAFSATSLASLALADPFVVDSDMFGYDITVTRYGSLADAMAQQNAVSGPHTVLGADPSDPRGGMRDVWMGFYKDRPSYYNNFAGLMTAWYFTLDPNQGDGWGNPNNTNTGFVQVYDNMADSVVSWTGGWSTLAPGVGDGSSFTFTVTGGMHADPAEYPRLWAAPEIGGAGEITKGIFHQYYVSATVTGLTANDDGFGWYESMDAPGGISGGFTGIFENQSTTRPELNGFYYFSGALNMDNWAVANGGTWGGGVYSPYAYFGAVPEPGSMAALGLGMLALKLRRRSRR